MSNCLDKDLISEFHLQLDVAASQQLYILLRCIALLAVVSLWYLQLHYQFGMFHLIERTLGIGLSKIGKPKDNSRLWACGPESRIGEKEKYCMCIKGYHN